MKEYEVKPNAVNPVVIINKIIDIVMQKYQLIMQRICRSL